MLRCSRAGPTPADSPPRATCSRPWRSSRSSAIASRSTTPPTPTPCSTPTRRRRRRSSSRTRDVAQVTEEHGRDLVPRRALQRAYVRRFTETHPQVAIAREAPQGRGKSSHIARLHDQPFAIVLGKIRQVARPPAAHGQAEPQRLPVDRAVRLLETG